MGWRDTLDVLKDRTIDLAQAGVAQSKRLAEIAKLKTENMAEEDTIRKAYIEIGKLYYAEKGAFAEGAYASACDKITAAKAAIETNNDRVAELRDSGENEPDVFVEDTDIFAEPVHVAEPAAPAAEPAPVVVSDEDIEDEPAAEEPKEEPAETPAEEEPKPEA